MNTTQIIRTAALQGLRIARISTVPFFVVTQLKYQIAALDKAGACVTVVCSDGPELAAVKGLPSARCSTVDIPRSISPWRDLLALFKLIRLFRSERIQIAHSTTPKAGLLTAVAAFIARVPVRLHTFTGQPWVEMRGLIRWLARSSDWLIGKLNTQCYADSSSQADFLNEEGLIDDERLTVIGAGSVGGVDVLRFDPQRFTANDRGAMRRSLRIPEDAQILLFVGRITVDKGVRDLLQAFQLLLAGAINAHLVFVGKFDLNSGVAGCISRSEIERLPNTHVVGYSDCPEAFMAIADVLCLPSYREGFGTVVIEAAAMGLPTVGTNIYGLIDAVVHNETGLLVPPRNAEALSGAIGILLGDNGLRQKFSAAAMQRARTHFDAKVLNELIVEEYLRLARTKDLLT